MDSLREGPEQSIGFFPIQTHCRFPHAIGWATCQRIADMESLLRYLPIAIVLVIFFERLRELGTKRATIKGTLKEKLTFNLFLTCGVLVTFGSIAEYLWRGANPSLLLMALSVVLAVVSFTLRRRAIAALGQFWSLHVEIRDSHQFVREGPFRFVRHPAYFSMLLELLAISLSCGAFLTMLLIPLAFIPILLMRLRLEETALIEKFGPAYQEYQRSTPALFPWKW